MTVTHVWGRIAWTDTRSIVMASLAGIRRHKCEWCEYSTDSASNMTRHRRTHTGERPYRCGDCGKAFALRCGLMNHIRMHTGERPYVCDVCGKAFPLAYPLKEHRRIHTGEVLQCEQCSATFRTQVCYSTHMKIRHGMKALQCHMCPSRFISRASLIGHTRMHMGRCRTPAVSVMPGSVLNPP